MSIITHTTYGMIICVSVLSIFNSKSCEGQKRIYSEVSIPLNECMYGTKTSIKYTGCKDDLIKTTYASPNCSGKSVKSLHSTEKCIPWLEG